MKTLIAAAIAATLFSAPALAAAPLGTDSLAVRHADLDLATARGRAALDHRIRAAADALCGTASPADMQSQAAVRRCRTETVAAVLPQRDRLIAATGHRTATRLASQR
ncbi:MAG: UrcA family protein [Allosphingosinicella sp.]|uniref:UrcA family protein n=1 Tax=Allosphingosinicella sp. TaxID=2823234 RepID=UPI00394B1F76